MEESCPPIFFLFFNKKGCSRPQKPFYEYFNLFASVPLWGHSNGEKNQEDPKNGTMQALEIINQNYSCFCQEYAASKDVH